MHLRAEHQAFAVGRTGSQVLDQSPRGGHDFAGIVFALERVSCFKRVGERNPPDVIERLRGQVEYSTLYE